MDVLSRLQPLDFLLVVLWAGIVGWGLQTGVVRQVGMLLGVYVGAIAAGSLSKEGGQAIALAFGRDLLPRWEFIAYVAIFLIIFGLTGLVIWRAYPLSRLARKFGSDNLVGAMLGAIWGAMLLIVIVTILRYYAVTPWRGQEVTQQGILGQIQASQVAPVLRVVLAPLWGIMAPWFPTAVST
ncbi:MAG TPA: CvpA family protein [Chloroflexota bacterium]